METGHDILSREDYQGLLKKKHVRVGGDNSSCGNFREHTDSGFYGHSGGDPETVTLMNVDETTDYGRLVFVIGTPADEGF